MGPAILLCPSSSAAHLWGQVSPLKKTRQKDGSTSLSHSACLRCSANAHCAGDFKRRPAFRFHLAPSSDKCRKLNCPPAWERVSAAASGSEVSVEEATVPLGEAPAEQSSESSTSSREEIPVATEQAPAATAEAPVTSETRAQTRRSLNRSNSNANKAVVVSPAELLPGAVFPGKVVSIQSFGAFVDLGAFTNGLVHISRLSKSFVKKVEDVVQIGQDVKVQVLEVDLQANRISLMLVQEGKEEASQEGETGEKQLARSPRQQSRTPRRESSKQTPSQRPAVTTTMKKGEIATGTVKNIIKSGVFITLPDGTDGYLPAGEVVFKGPNMSMESQFQVGQELTVRVLRIDKGRVNLTMKREVNFDQLNEDLNKGVVDGATNPFEIAFRRNELIASFLSDRDKQKAEAEAKEQAKRDEAASSATEAGMLADSTTHPEVKDVAEVEKPPVKEVEDNVANEVDASKDEGIFEVASSVEEVKAATESDKPAAEEGEEKVASVIETSKDEGILLEAVDSVEEAKAVAEVEKPAVEEEEEKLANGVDTTKDEALSTEAILPVEEKVPDGVETMKDDAVSTEAVSSVEEEKHEVANDEAVSTEEQGVNTVKDEAVSTNEAVNSVEEEEGKVANGVETRKVEGVATKAVRSVEEEEEKVANGVETREVEGVATEAVSSIEEEVEKAVNDEAGATEEAKVANGVDTVKDEAVSTEAINSVEEEEKVRNDEAVSSEEANGANGIDIIKDEAVEEAKAIAEVEKLAVRSQQP